MFPELKSMRKRGTVGKMSCVYVERKMSQIPESTDADSTLDELSSLELLRYTFHSISSVSLNHGRAIHIYCQEISFNAFRIRKKTNQKV